METWGDYSGLVLHVKKMWHVCGSPPFALCYVRAVWIEIFRRLDLVWVMPATVGALLASWSSLGSPPQI